METSTLDISARGIKKSAQEGHLQVGIEKAAFYHRLVVKQIR